MFITDFCKDAKLMFQIKKFLNDDEEEVSKLDRILSLQRQKKEIEKEIEELINI